MKNNELEGLRAFASLYVFFHHTFYNFNILENGSFLWRLFSFGQEAVMVFFLLSGYVITLSMDKNNYNFKTYFKHRFYRIYSIVLIAYFVSYISNVQLLNKALPTVNDLILNLLMLQDKSSFNPSTYVEPLFNNQPLWSLSYEWWFYMLFFIQLHLFKKFSQMINLVIASFTSLIGMFVYYFYPNQIASILIYYYLWFAGGALFYYYKYNEKDRTYIYALIIGYIVLITSYIFLFVIGAQYKASVVFPYIKLRHFIASFVFVLFIIYFYHYFNAILKAKITARLIGSFVYFAPISFSIYVVHYPIMKVFQNTDINSFEKLFYTILVTFAISYIAEIKLYTYLKRKYI
jgi:peptidoglycan/LPS O-acetylase OafA/YrhL